MESHHRRRRGFTLIELLVVVAIALIAVTAGTALFRHVIPAERTRATINNLRGFLEHARYTAMDKHDSVMVCRLHSDCSDFHHAHGLVAFLDRNHDHRREDGEPVVGRLQFADTMDAEWRSFRNKPWLEYRSTGFSWYQSGHFELCLLGSRYRLVLNQIGKMYIKKPRGFDDSCEA